MIKYEKNYFVDVISDGICMGNAVVLNLETKRIVLLEKVLQKKKTSLVMLL
ncbi:MAG: hypothetical protein L6U99_04195 [Clostridium sp.]|nr:MAG: hypothetical protein L6U99_04195 [Clostridium sp.]